ncbi:MAG: hypothetical protein ACXV7J_12785 [Methylomonas sp.]
MWLRFINALATTVFDIRIPGLKMRVIVADGQWVQPVDVEEFRIAVENLRRAGGNANRASFSDFRRSHGSQRL